MESAHLNSKMVNIFLGITLIYFLLNDRLVLQLNTGGRGILNYFEVIVFISVIFLVFLTNARVLKVIYVNEFVLFYAPFFILSIMLPLLGVLIYDYPIRSLMYVVQILISIGFVIIGYYLYLKSNSLININIILLFVISGNFIFAISHYLYYRGFFTGVLSPIVQWDRNFYIQYGYEYIIGRSSGLFLNPNILAFFAVFAFWYSVLLAKRSYKPILIILSLGLIFFSMSRGAILALIISGTFCIIIKLLGKVTIKFILAIPIVGVLLVVIVGVGIDYLDETSLNRLKAIYEIFIYGLRSDGNFSARIDAWLHSFNFVKDYPLGTFGSPELKINSYIDNEFIRIFMQGSVLFLFSYVLFLLKAIFTRKIFSDNLFLFMAVLSIAIMILSITQTSSTFTSFNLIWLFIGIVIAKKECDKKMHNITEENS